MILREFRYKPLSKCMISSEGASTRVLLFGFSLLYLKLIRDEVFREGKQAGLV